MASPGNWERPVVEGNLRWTGEEAHRFLLAYTGTAPGDVIRMEPSYMVPMMDIVLRRVRLHMPEFQMQDGITEASCGLSADTVEYRRIDSWALAPQTLLRLLEEWAALGDEPMPISVVVRRVREAIGTASAQGSVPLVPEPAGSGGRGHWEPAPGCEKVHPYGEEGWLPMSDGHSHWVPAEDGKHWTQEPWC